MTTFQYKVNDALGLHARPAGLLVKCAAACDSDIMMELNGKTANAKRLFAVMGLCAKQNDEVKFTITGSNEEADCAKLKEFCEQNF